MRKIKNYLKTGILLIGISLLFWNCEKENESEFNSIETIQNISNIEF